MGALQTERLSLQPFDTTHIEAMHDLCIQPEVRRYLFKDQIIPRTEVEGMVSASEQSFKQCGAGFYAVIITDLGHPQEGRFAGFCGLRNFAPEGEGASGESSGVAQQMELLFGMNPKIWGRGFGAEAARAVLAHGYQACEMSKIVAAADTPNQRSIRVLQKLGMSFRERRQWHGWDTMFYEMTAQEFACL